MAVSTKCLFWGERVCVSICRASLRARRMAGTVIVKRERKIHFVHIVGMDTWIRTTCILARVYSLLYVHSVSIRYLRSFAWGHLVCVCDVRALYVCVHVHVYCVWVSCECCFLYFSFCFFYCTRAHACIKLRLFVCILYIQCCCVFSGACSSRNIRWAVEARNGGPTQCRECYASCVTSFTPQTRGKYIFFGYYVYVIAAQVTSAKDFIQPVHTK